MQLKIFPFNPFQVNTYILFDETKECIIIDPSCYDGKEEQELMNFIQDHELKPKMLLNTHCHIDHILGNNFIYRSFGLKPIVHKDSIYFLENAVEHGLTFGFQIEPPVMPEQFIEQDQLITFGDQQLKVLETPGHAAGSVCFYHEGEKVLIAGDVLFQQGIGRTDLPTGDYDLLIRSIHDQLLTLPGDVKVYCGHGSSTTIDQEKQHNPYLQ
ncbi:MAG: MBL fold metallo-hydrolase [Bacteroidales bacterium]